MMMSSNNVLMSSACLSDAVADHEIPQYTFDDIAETGGLMINSDTLVDCGQDTVSMNPNDIFLNSENNSFLIGKASPSRNSESGIESMCSPQSVIEPDSDFDIDSALSPTSLGSNNETSLDLLTYLTQETGLSVVELEPKPEAQPERKMTLRQPKKNDPIISTGGKTKPQIKQPIIIKPSTSSQEHCTSSRPQRICTKMQQRSPSFTCEDDDDQSFIDPSRKNAIQAKINREKKKLYVASLENDVVNLKEENQTLKIKHVKMEKEMKIIQDEVTYLRNVLANQSTLSSLLKNIPHVSDISLTTSFKRRYNVENDHGYQKPKRPRVNQNGGVCLHVENNKVSLEFCSKCAKLANDEDINE